MITKGISKILDGVVRETFFFLRGELFMSRNFSYIYKKNNRKMTISID